MEAMSMQKEKKAWFSWILRSDTYFRRSFTDFFCYRFQRWIVNPIQGLKSHKRI